MGLAVSFIASDDVTRNLLAAGAAEVIAWPALPTPPVRSRRVHAADHLLSALRARLDAPARAVPRLPVPEDIRRRARATLNERGLEPGRFLALHPGSGAPRKNWPAGHFADLARLVREGLGLKAAVIRGPVEAEREGDIPAALGAVADSVILCPGLPLLAGILAEAAAYAGNDSGVTHLAAACGAPTAAVFGPTDPGVWGPRGGLVRTVRDESGEVARVPPGQVFSALRELVSAGT